LNACPISGTTHNTVQGVNFPHQMAFTQPPDRRIAGHDANCINPQRHQRCFHTHPRRRMSRLCSGVPATYDDNIKMFHVKQSLFPNTETGENFVQQMLHIDSANQRIQRPNSSVQFFRSNLGATRRVQYVILC
jgi:hypothetical protein